MKPKLEGERSPEPTGRTVFFVPTRQDRLEGLERAVREWFSYPIDLDTPRSAPPSRVERLGPMLWVQFGEWVSTDELERFTHSVGGVEVAEVMNS